MKTHVFTLCVLIVQLSCVQLSHSQTALTSSSAAKRAGSMGHDMPQHNHTPRALAAEVATPTLSMQLFTDKKSGYNLQLNLSNYHLIPPQLATTDNSAITQGHAHLYVNGTKIQRVYSEHTHLPAKLFNKGLNQIMVSLNSHEHETWTKAKQPILSTLFINTEKNTLIQHEFSPFSRKSSIISN
jgi:hypothetical protein